MRQLVAAQQGLASGGAHRRPAGPARPTRAPTLLSWRAAPCADTGFLRARSLVISHASTKLLKPQLLFVGVAQAGDGMSPDKTQWGGQFDGHVQPPRISKPDQEFASAGLEFVEGTEGILLTELNDLFQKVNFPRRDPEKLRIALENTYHVVWVRATRQSRMARMGQLIGFARATSDGSLSATIWDVAVNPAWQRVGLGRAMMERLTKRLVEDGIPTITLYAEPGVVRLYEKLGFVKDPDGIRGLAFQRKKKERVGLATPSLR